MASKEKINLGQFQDDFDFDDDWGMNISAPKDNTDNGRNPVKRVGKSVLRGMGESALTTGMARTILKSALPQSFTVALNNTDNALRDSRQLYRDVAKNVSPMMREMRNLGMNVSRVLPKSMGNRLSGWLRQSGGNTSAAAALAQMNMEDLAVNRNLTDIFGENTTGPSENPEQKRDEIVKALTEAEYRKKLGTAITGIQDLLNRQTTYNFTVQRAFQRKSMEIQIRQLMVQRATLDVAQKSAVETSNLLRAIVENSALPNEVKVHNSEAFKKMMKERLYGKVQNSLSEWTSGYRQQIGNRIRQKAQDIFQAITTGASLGSDVFEGINNQREMAEMEGIDPLEWASGAAGTHGAMMLGSWIGRQARRRLPGLQKANNPLQRLNYLFNNKERLASDWANSGYDYNKWYNPATNILKDLLRGSYNDQGEVRTGGLSGLESRAGSPETRKLRALEEIIPGYLSRILHSIDIMRTGDTSTERVVYNGHRGTFTTMKQSTNDVRNTLLSDSEIAGQRRSIDSLIGNIDPEGKLTGNSRKVVSDFLFNRSRTSKAFNPSTLANMRLPGLSSEENKVWQGLLASRYGMTLNDDNRWETGAFSGNNVNLNRDAGDYNYASGQTAGLFNRAHLLAQGGNLEQLINDGALNWKDGKWVLNRDYYTKRVNGEETSATDSTGSPKENATGPSSTHRPRTFTTDTTGRGQYDFAGYNTSVNLGRSDFSVLGLGENKRPDLGKIIAEQVDRIIENSTPYHQHQVEGLEELIAEIQGLRAEGSIGGTGGSSENQGASAPRRRVSKLRRQLGKLKTLGRLGKKAFDLNWKITGLPFKGAAIAARHLTRPFLGMGVNTLRGVGSFLFNKVSDGYIYTSNGLKKVIDKEGLRTGRYINQKTGEVIKKLSDIKGAVWDRIEQTQVLSDDEAKEGLLDSAGKVIKTKATKIIQALGKTAFALAVPKIGVGVVAGKAFGLARRLLNRLPDVYVPGERTPRLFASKIARGDYYQIATGKRVQSISDLNGEIGTIDPLTKKITPVLTAEEVARGLVDRKGRPLRTGIGKMFGAAGSLLRLGLSPVTGAFKTLHAMGNLAGKGVDGALNLVSRLIPGFHGGSLGRRDGGYLPKIYRLLYNHFTGKPVVDESEPDGSVGGVFNRAKGRTRDFLGRLKARSGSWVNRVAGFIKRKPKEEKKVVEKKKGSGMMGLILSAIGGIGGVLAKIGKGFSTFFKWIVGLPRWIAALKTGNAAIDAAADLATGGGKGGIVRKLGRGAWRAAKFLGRGALSLGGLALRGAVAGGEVVAGAVASAGALPVIIAAAVAVGVGLLIYKGWTMYRDRLTDLRQYRVAAYGIDPSDKEKAGKVLALEEVILKHSTFDSNGKLKVGSLNFYELMTGFGIDSTDQRSVLRFTRWYRLRFSPVFARSVEVLHQRDPKAKITDATFLKDSEKPQYARDTFIPNVNENSPYAISDSPFPNTTSIIGERWPGLYRDKIINAYRKEEKLQPELKGALSKVNTATPVPSPTTQRGMKTPTGSGTFKVNADASDLYFSPGDKGAPLGSITGNPTRDELFMIGNRIDDLTSIRVKLYGLTSLEKDNVNQLLSFERTLYPDVKKGAHGEVNYTKSTDEAFNANFGHFGVNPNNLDEKAQWTYWFEHRFLPVYLNFIAQSQKIQPNLSPFNAWQKLTASDLLSIANAMNKSTTVVKEKKLSIWVISSSPWPNQTSGTDPSIINGNLDALRAMTKRETYAENAKVQDTLSKERFDGKKLSATPVGRKIADFQGDMLGVMANNNARGNASNPNAAGAYAQNYRGFGTSFDVSGAGMNYINGNVAHMGNGTGGSINDLPKSKGDGWDANRDLIIAAAKMAGVDAASLTAIIAQESSFKASAGAGKSSAKGLGQFTSGTWRQMLPILVKKYGVNPNTPATDPAANVLATAEYMKQNVAAMGNIGRPITTSDIYLAHFLGPGGAKRVLTASPDTDIRQALGSLYEADARSNPNIFEGVRTVSDLQQRLNSYLAKNSGAYVRLAQDYSAASSGSTSTTSDASTPTTPPIPVGAKTPLPTGDVVKNSLGKKSTETTPPIPAPASTTDFSEARTLNDNITNAQHRAVRTRQESAQTTVNDTLGTGDAMNQALGIFRNMDKNLASILQAIQGFGGKGNGGSSPKETESDTLAKGTQLNMPGNLGKNSAPRPFNTSVNVAKYK